MSNNISSNAYNFVHPFVIPSAPHESALHQPSSTVLFQQETVVFQHQPVYVLPQRSEKTPLLSSSSEKEEKNVNPVGQRSLSGAAIFLIGAALLGVTLWHANGNVVTVHNVEFPNSKDAKKKAVWWADMKPVVQGIPVHTPVKKIWNVKNSFDTKTAEKEEKEALFAPLQKKLETEQSFARSFLVSFFSRLLEIRPREVLSFVVDASIFFFVTGPIMICQGGVNCFLALGDLWQHKEYYFQTSLAGFMMVLGVYLTGGRIFGALFGLAVKIYFTLVSLTWTLVFGLPSLLWTHLAGKVGQAGKGAVNIAANGMGNAVRGAVDVIQA